MKIATGNLLTVAFFLLDFVESRPSDYDADLDANQLQKSRSRSSTSSKKHLLQRQNSNYGNEYDFAQNVDFSAPATPRGHKFSQKSYGHPTEQPNHLRSIAIDLETGKAKPSQFQRIYNDESQRPSSSARTSNAYASARSSSAYDMIDTDGGIPLTFERMNSQNSRRQSSARTSNAHSSARNSNAYEMIGNVGGRLSSSSMTPLLQNHGEEKPHELRADAPYRELRERFPYDNPIQVIEKDKATGNRRLHRFVELPNSQILHTNALLPPPSDAAGVVEILEKMQINDGNLPISTQLPRQKSSRSYKSRQDK